jgi:hypothetical protein
VRRRSLRRGLVAIGLLLAACSDDGGSTTTTTTAPPATTTSTTVADGTDPALQELLLAEDDLPEGFAVATAAADTVTTFCVGQDATAGLQAAARALVTFKRTPEGAAVIQIVFRFKGAGASTFVAQATQLFETCNEVPGEQGLAFTYGPAPSSVDAALAPTTSHAARNGTSIGSGSLRSTTAVFQVGDDVAELVSVLGIDQPRDELDELATTVVEAAVAKAT